MQQNLNLGNDDYRGIVGVENERAIQSLNEFDVGCSLKTTVLF